MKEQYTVLSDQQKQQKLDEISSYLDNEENLSLIHLEFILTNRCNCQCDYCFELDQIKQRGRGQPQDITWDIMLYYINLVRNNRIKLHIPQSTYSKIIFFGGEPLLKKDLIIQCLQECEKDSFWIFSIISNGTIGWDSAFIQLCKDKEIDVQISLDGNFTSNNHRIYKNNKLSFYDTYKTILQFRGYSNFLISAVISEDNIDNIYNNFLFFEKLGVVRIQLFLDRIHIKITKEIEDKIHQQFILIGEHIVEKIKKKEIYSIPLGTLSFLKSIEDNTIMIQHKARLYEQPDGLALYIVSPSGDLLFTTNEIMSSYQNILGKGILTKESIMQGIKEQFLEKRTYLTENYCENSGCICSIYHFPQCENNLILKGCFHPTCLTFQGECLVGLMMIKAMSEVK